MGGSGRRQSWMAARTTDRAISRVAKEHGCEIDQVWETEPGADRGRGRCGGEDLVEERTTKHGSGEHHRTEGNEGEVDSSTSAGTQNAVGRAAFERSLMGLPTSAGSGSFHTVAQGGTGRTVARTRKKRMENNNTGAVAGSLSAVLSVPGVMATASGKGGARSTESVRGKTPQNAGEGGGGGWHPRVSQIAVPLKLCGTRDLTFSE